MVPPLRTWDAGHASVGGDHGREPVGREPDVNKEDEPAPVLTGQGDVRGIELVKAGTGLDDVRRLRYSWAALGLCPHNRAVAVWTLCRSKSHRRR